MRFSKNNVLYWRKSGYSIDYDLKLLLYSLDWNFDGIIDERDKSETREYYTENLVKEIDFGFGDELVVELWDEDIGEDDFITRWRVDDPADLENLTDLQGNQVNFTVKKLKG